MFKRWQKDEIKVSLDLIHLEKCYISCLLNGAKVRDIKLSEHNEPVHKEIKRLKDKGFILIPRQIIRQTNSEFYPDIEREFVDMYFREILEEQKKRAIQLAAREVKNAPLDIIITNLQEELEKIANQTGRAEILSADNLQKKEYKNTEFIIDRIIPVGMTLLIGAPKAGKSWLLLSLAEAVAVGTGLFGLRAK